MKNQTQILVLCCSLLAANGAFAGTDKASSKAGVNGVPFQRMQTQINDLSAELEATKLEIQNQLTDLNAQLVGLQDQLDSMESGNNEELMAEIDRVRLEIEILEGNLTALEDSLSTGCPEGFSLRAVLSDGSVVCETMAGETNEAGNLKRLVVMESTTVNVFNIKQATAICPPGYDVTGGGYETPTGYYINSITVTKNRPNGFGWTVEVQNFSSSPVQFKSYAICVSS